VYTVCKAGRDVQVDESHLHRSLSNNGTIGPNRDLKIVGALLFLVVYWHGKRQLLDTMIKLVWTQGTG